MSLVDAEGRTAVQVRITGRLFSLVEDWRRRQPQIVSRAAALRVLLEQALTDASVAQPSERRPS